MRIWHIALFIVIMNASIGLMNSMDIFDVSVSPAEELNWESQIEGSTQGGFVEDSFLGSLTSSFSIFKDTIGMAIYCAGFFTELFHTMGFDYEDAQDVASFLQVIIWAVYVIGLISFIRGFRVEG